LRLFTEHGYESTSLQSIADAIGVTKAAVYYYFRTKTDILEALVRPMIDDIHALLDRIEALPPGEDRFETHVVGFADLLISRRHTLALLMIDPVTQDVLRANLTAAKDFEQRALRLLFGAQPSPRQRAGHHAAGKLVGILPRLADVDDDCLRAVLVDIVRGLWDAG
jgi:AcrR family transcriptional regulator